ncbi:hypothetical protein AAHC03_05753 [Spirometra sp. Aus1]
MPLPYGRRRANVDLDEEEDTKAFFLDRKIEVKKNKDVEADYNIGEYIGSGKFGDVSRCVEKVTGYELAAKVIPIHSPEDTESVMNEVTIMNKLRHARLIQLYDVYTKPDKITLIMELITGGELFERIIDEHFDLNEDKCVRFMTEILQGVDYMHSQNVLHLDLKPENILCLTRTGFRIKIIDFGLARELKNQELRVLFGTPEFVAPEVISYDPVSYASDMWSVGVICYVLLSGLSPFMGDNESETLSNIVRCVYSFDYSEFNDISQDAKDFIRKLLVKDMKKRFTSTQCLAHSWLRGKGKIKRSATVNKARLKHFVYRRKWQKAVNAIIALQRMGVVLTHNNEKTNIRKFLQMGPSKTVALTRRASIQPPPKEVLPVTVDIKRNKSFQSGSPPALRKPESNTSTDTGNSVSPAGKSQMENATVPPKQNSGPNEVKTNEMKSPPAAATQKAPTIIEPSKKEERSILRNTVQEPSKVAEQKKENSQLPRNDDKQPKRTQEQDRGKPAVPGGTVQEQARIQAQDKRAAQVTPIEIREPTETAEAPGPLKEQKSNSTTAATPAPKPTSPRPQNSLPPKSPMPSEVVASSSRKTSSASVASTASSARSAAQNLVTVKMASLSRNTPSIASRIQMFTAAAEAAEKKGATVKNRKKFSLYQ